MSDDKTTLTLRQDGKAASGPAGASAADATASQQPVNLASESVAGEEDPGASMDMAAGSTSAPKANNPISAPSGAVNPGDEAPPGTPGTGENICRECGGSGRLNDAECVSCGGSGKVIVGVGGA